MRKRKNSDAAPRFVEPDTRELDWFDYALHIPADTTGYSHGMFLQSLGYSLQDASWIFFSAEERLDIELGADEGDWWGDYDFKGKSPEAMFPADLSMKRFKALLEAGVPAGDAILWTRIGVAEDLPVSEMVAYALRPEVDIARLIEPYDSRQRDKRLDFYAMYNSVANGIDFSMMEDLGIYTRLRTGESVFISLIDYRGRLEATIESEGYQKFTHTILPGVYNDYLGREGEDGTSFYQQLNKEKPSDSRAAAVRTACLDVVSNFCGGDVQQIRAKFQYALDYEARDWYEN